LLFGAGGRLVDAWRDRAVGLPPLNAALAKCLMEQTRIYAALNGVSRPAADLAALENLLISFSRLVVEQPLIEEIDVSPVLASSSGAIVLSVRMTLCAPHQPAASLPKLVIRPYQDSAHVGSENLRSKCRRSALPSPADSLTTSEASFLAEPPNVFGAGLRCHFRLALNNDADLLDDLGVGKRSDVANLYG